MSHYHLDGCKANQLRLDIDIPFKLKRTSIGIFGQNIFYENVQIVGYYKGRSFSCLPFAAEKFNQNLLIYIYCCYQILERLTILNFKSSIKITDYYLI